MFQDIQSIIPENIKRAGISAKMNKARLLEIYTREIKNHLPPALAGRVRPLGIEGDTILVASLADEATRVITQKEEEILRILNTAAGKTVVKRVRYLT